MRGRTVCSSWAAPTISFSPAATCGPGLISAPWSTSRSPPWTELTDFFALEPVFRAYRDWLLRFAGIFRIQTVDFSLPAFAPPEGMRLYLDGLHPNREGHRLMADALCAALPPIHL